MKIKRVYICITTLKIRKTEIKTFNNISICISTLYAKENTYIKQQVAYKDQGASGKELTWDFGMLSPINEEYTVAYSIPDSNYMHQWCATEHRTRYYYTLTADTIWRTGYENPTTFVQYTQPEAVLRLPLRYGDTLSTTFAAKGEYGHRTPITLSGTNTIEVDAQGKLILPDKTYEQVLRVHSQRQYVESGLDSTDMLVDKYQWFAAESYIPVFESVTAYEMVEDSMQLAFQTSFYYHIEDTTASTPDGLCTFARTDPYPRDEPRAKVLGDSKRFDRGKSQELTSGVERVSDKFLNKKGVSPDTP